jgi:transcriptional regulator with XRE-family HTH domain
MKSKILTNIGDQIRVHRTKKKFSQENMANDLGISVAAYSRIERGQTNVSIGRLEQISACLDVPLIRLMCPIEGSPRAIGGTTTVKEENSNNYLSDHNQQVLLMRLEEKLTRIMEEKIALILEEKFANFNRDTADDETFPPYDKKRR